MDLASGQVAAAGAFFTMRTVRAGGSSGRDRVGCLYTRFNTFDVVASKLKQENWP